MRILTLVSLILISLNAFAQNSSDVLFDEGKYEEAEAEYEKLIKESHPEPCYACKLGLARTQIRLGKLDQSIDHINEVVSQADDQHLLAEANTLLGEAYLNKGRNDLAQEVLEKALLIFETLGNELDLDLAQCYSDLGLVYWNSGNVDRALQYQQRVLDIRKKILGEENVLVGDAYNNLGLILTGDQSKKAGEQYEMAYRIYLQNYGETHPKVALALNNIAIIHRNNGDYAEALKKFEQSLDIWNNLNQGDHTNKAFVFTNIGLVYKQQNQLELAMAYYTDALEIYQSIFGKRHPEVANVHTLIASVLLQQGKFKSSIRKYNESINANLISQELTDIYQNPELTDYYNPNILLTSLQLKARAFEGLHYNRTLKPRDIKMTLSSLELCDSLIVQLRQSRQNEADKIALGKIANEVYEDAVRLNLAYSEVSLTPARYRSRAFYFAEKSKASVLLGAINDTKAKHFAGMPDYVLHRESVLKTDVYYYDQKVAESTGEDLDEYRTLLLEASNKYHNFIEELEKQYPRYYNLKYNQKQVSIKELQSKLTENTGFISYFKADSSNSLYVFMVTKKHFKYYDFELSTDISKWSIGLRNAIQHNMSEFFVESSTTLAKQLMPRKLPAYIENLVIIPDGIMNTIPFEVLIRDYTVDGEINFAQLPYLLNDYDISYDFSATLFHQRQEQADDSGKLKKALLVAPVDFNLKGTYLPSLPDSKNEVIRLTQLFSAKNQEVKSLIQDQASESVIKNNDIQDYQYLHFATHGEIDEVDPRLSRIYLNSTIDNDGHLFSSEIYNLKINAELVTLSACETGLGKVSKGEGIIGLSRALMYAGAKNIIVSLWKVADKSTSELMIDFYDNHLNSGTYPEFNKALRQAKLTMIKEGEFASPYYWAPFILIGR